MARKHVISYYLEQEQAYLQLLDTIKELDELHRDGKIDYDRYSELRDRLAPQVEELKAPYELMSYVIFLLNIPNRPKKGRKYITQNKIYFKYLEKFSKEGMPDENGDALKVIKSIIQEATKDEGR